MAWIPWSLLVGVEAAIELVPFGYLLVVNALVVVMGLV